MTSISKTKQKLKYNFIVLMSLTLMGCQNNPTSKSVYWPQSSGPNANWTVQSDEEISVDFSVRIGKNILWNMELPEVGQGGITIWENKIFLTVMNPLYEEFEKDDLKTNTVLALCIDANKQEILWQRELIGTAKSPYFYGFSDSTTPGPITDGNYIWFYNASGQIVCFDMEGTKIWERNWKPIEELGGIHYPFNKQFEPILYNDILINMETYWKEDEDRVFGWNYLYGLDKMTGEEVWISEESLTHYNTPTFNTTESGIPALLIGRGAYHKVPESPIGYSLVDINTGKSIWRYEAGEGMAITNSLWNQEHALWFTEEGSVVHKIDAKTGKLIEKIPLGVNVDLRTYDTLDLRYNFLENIVLGDSMEAYVFPAWYTNIIVNDNCYFLCFKKNRRLKFSEPEYVIGKLNLITNKVEYLEVPVQYDYKDGKKVFDWHVNLINETKNIRELDVAFDNRSKSDGWVWNFNANPILLNEKLLYTTMSGVVYSIDTSREPFDEKAILTVNDLGPKGKTWTLNTPSYSEGRIYHRTSKHLICIDAKGKPSIPKTKK